ncbi:E3 ubiquitin-protein ligase [Nymphaea thermarum]|nr:E3 ubiquitin-protein ligase [Nymphaea thermarum]
MGRAAVEMDPPPLPEPPVYFPLRWESTGEQWWYATPVDLAAANGHYDLVRALLRVDSNLLIKLTSLRRIRRLETVWDDHPDFIHAPRGRAAVARALFHDCEVRGTNGANSLIRAGYGGWLLYTAAAAGDVEFIEELLRREPFLVFGEGEYGVTDILYAAARSRSNVVFTMILDAALMGEEDQREGKEVVEENVFKGEIMSRAVHAAARGGSWEVLREILLQFGDTLGCRDVQGCTVLHAAAARGQVEVVRNLVESLEITNCRDNQGNTALHLAAFRGHLEVVKVLILASLSLSSATNDAGDTFLHMAVSGFRTPGFRRLDRQMELMKVLVSGQVVCLAELINLKNNEGRTALHLAMIGNISCDLVELLMSVPLIDVNIRDLDGLTPLDLLNLHPHSASSEILIKQLVSAGGISNSCSHSARNALTSHLKMQSMGSSPGTSFKISDAEIFLYSGTENAYDPAEKACSVRSSSCSNSNKSGEFSHSEIMDMSPGPHTIHKPSNSVTSAARRLRNLLGWAYKKGRSKKPGSEQTEKDGTRSGWQHGGDEESMEDIHSWYDHQDTPTPLRQRFSTTSLLNNKRTLAIRSILPSPSAKKRFAAGLMHGVIQGMPSQSSSEPTSSEKNKGVESDHENEPSGCKTSVISEPSDKLNSSNRLMNQYFCFGAHGLFTENQIPDQQGGHPYGRSIFSEA